MSVRTVNNVSRSGLNESGLFAAADSSGDVVPNDGNMWVEWTNTDVAAVTVTVNATIDGVVVPIKTITVPATIGRVKAGNFPPGWNNSSGQMSFTYNAVTANFKIAAFNLY